MAEPTYIQFLDKVEEALRALDLGHSITRAVLPDDGQFTHRGVVVSWDDEKAATGTNERDDVTYNAVIAIVSGSTKSWSGDMPGIANTRDLIFKRFNNQRLFLDDCDDAPLPMKVVFGPIGLPEKWQENRNMGVLQVQGRYRRNRTLP